MATTILTPITLWRDFDDTLPLDGEVLSEALEGEIVHRKVSFYGRQTQEGRVKIFAHYYYPADTAHFSAVLTLFEAGMPVDETMVSWLTERGYAVLVPDYCGEDGSEEHTVYPVDVDYANLSRAGNAIYHVENTAKETSWYEWAAVARYAVRYLREQEGVVKVGAMGMRTGSEILWKITPFAALDCFISVCSAGWLAYRGKSKFERQDGNEFNEERHRFIAGIDSQSYAPYCKCPVLLLSAINDRKYNCDRTYDTFRAVNPEVEKAILFSARTNGLLGSHSLTDAYLFLDKYLKGRSVFVSKPVEVSVTEDEEGNLVASCIYDTDGEIVESGIFFTEGVSDFRSYEWTRILIQREGGELVERVPFEVYANNERVLLYAFARYSNGFSVTSKIQDFALTKRYRNMSARSRVIYDSTEGLNGFTAYRQSGRAVGDCFLVNEGQTVSLTAGYGGIMGISSPLGLITHRVAQPRFRASEGVAFQMDAYSENDCFVNVLFLRNDENANVVPYSAKAWIEGRGKWKRIVLEAEDFKSETGMAMTDFTGVSALVLLGEGVSFNNVIWL